jgi:hypothetical protein
VQRDVRLGDDAAELVTALHDAAPQQRVRDVGTHVRHRVEAAGRVGEVVVELRQRFSRTSVIVTVNVAVLPAVLGVARRELVLVLEHVAGARTERTAVELRRDAARADLVQRPSTRPTRPRRRRR